MLRPKARSFRLFRNIVVGGILGAAVWTASVAAADPVPRGDAAALNMCAAATNAAAEYGALTGLARGETSTAAKVAAWQELRHASEISGIVSPLRSVAADALVTVCMYSGVFVTPVGPPGPDGAPRPQHDVIRLLVTADGTATLDAAGYKGRLSPETPGDWEATR